MSYLQSNGHFGTRRYDGHSAFSLEKGLRREHWKLCISYYFRWLRGAATYNRFCLYCSVSESFAGWRPANKRLWTVLRKTFEVNQPTRLFFASSSPLPSSK
jgi:hypothetical protein